MVTTMANFKKMLPFLIFCVLFSAQTTCFNNETDFVSLLAIKYSLKDPEGSLNSWNQTTHYCSWRGIQCSRRHPNRVVEINLRSQGLIGSLSPHIGNLSFLKTIILQYNTFHGQIPQELSRLRRLEFVEFSNNSFVGPIPKNLSQCTNFVYLNLIDNKLSGTIPVEFVSMNKLEALAFGKNNLSGPIPSFLGNMTSLKMLSLKSCGFSGQIPESLVRLKSLIFLQLSENGLTGTIPSGLFNTSGLMFLGVSLNNLHGVIPSSIGLTLPNLRRLLMFENEFTGPIPVSISNASFLERIVLSNNHFTGPMPRVEKLTHLQHFIFGSNLIQDDISFISSLVNSTKLETLEVDDNFFSGSIPESVANLSSHLRRLYLHKNRIHGTIPLGIENHINLTSLYLSDNYLEGPIPVGFTKLSNLRHLSIGRNKLIDKLPFSLGNLTLLTRLFLDGNTFSGNVPLSLGNCRHLLELDLSHNNLNGLIPPQIMSLSSLAVTLNLSYNAFEGSIPYEVIFLTNLGSLDLSNNRLSGSIPSSLAKCISLQKLYLEGNLLEGEIPTRMSALMGLQYLDLSRNNLSGSIPSFLQKLNLEKLNVSFNRLHGEVPIRGVFMNKTLVSLDGNEGLCGGIWELKLPPCHSLEKKKLSTFLKILIPILAAGGICLLVLFFVFFAYKQRVLRENNVASSLLPFTGLQFQRVSYADLLKATDGFNETNLLGDGRFGSVYKGILDDGETMVAVKVLNLFVRGASKSFIVECNALRGIRHRNLLKILSVCESIDFQGNEFKALIYDFKANGSLEQWLYDSMGVENVETKNLDMIQRLNIAIDIAQALEYLHSGTDSFIIHGDLKPSNILLDHDMTACIGDFGLSDIISNMDPLHESSTVGIRGTLGYIPPEYATNNKFSSQGDVYSYGILLMEMFTNKRPTTIKRGI